MDRFITRYKKVSTERTPTSTASSDSSTPVACNVTVDNPDDPTISIDSTDIDSQVSKEDNSEANDSENEADADSSDHIDSAGPTSKKQKLNYTQRHRPAWEKQFCWLTCSDNNLSYCKVCQKRITSKINHIKRHEKTSLHQTNFNKSMKTPTLDKYNINTQTNTIDKEAKKTELKCIMFLHEHNLPFLLMDHLQHFLKSACPDSNIAKKIKCSRTKSTLITTDCIVKEAKDVIKKTLDNNVYSLIIDETTDVSTQKSLVILIRYWDGNSIRDKFLSLVRLNLCTADAIFTAVCGVLNNYNIDLDKIIGFAGDNAAVMMGHKGGVQAKFKEINPNIFVLGCTCHSFHLCASAAAKKLPASVEELARNIFNHFSNSSYRSEGLGEFQEFTNVKPCKMLHPSQTRWLSLQAVVDRILHSWDALRLYFIHAVEVDNLHNTRNILQCLQNPVYKMYFLFLSYILDIVNKLNIEFQSEAPKIHVLHMRVTELFKTILKNFVVRKKLNDIHHLNPTDPHNFVTIDKMYCGAKVELEIASGKIENNEIEKFRTNVLAFYVELSVQIKKRFDFADPLLNFLSNFHPNNAISGEIGSIVPILKYFPNLNLDVELLNNEWRLLPDVEAVKNNGHKNFVDFWSDIIAMKNELQLEMFPNLSVLIKSIMTLPHSSASCERIFSQLTLMKTKLRNRLCVSTCDAIIHAKQLLGNELCFSWQPAQTLINRVPNYNLNKANRQ